MQKLKICADSTCDLSPEILEEFSIRTIPLNIICGDDSYKDGVDIVPENVYRLVAEENKLCSTAAINTFEYQEFFRSILEEAEQLIYISISSELSTCFQNATKASEEFNGRVFVVDSRNLSSGIGHIVYEAALMARDGIDAVDIVKKLNDLIGKVEVGFVVDTMDYLKRGGRCSALTAFGASVLNIKPCIEVIDGKMTVATTYRGSMEKCLKRFVKERLLDRDDIVYDRIFVTHASCTRELVDMIFELVREYGSFDNIIETHASCTISCHCGPGTLGILFIRK